MQSGFFFSIGYNSTTKILRMQILQFNGSIIQDVYTTYNSFSRIYPFAIYGVNDSILYNKGVVISTLGFMSYSEYISYF
jgi:hypothetical protein